MTPSPSSISIRTLLAACILAGSAWFMQTLRAAEPNPKPFVLMQEFYGPEGYTDPAIRLNLADGMMNAVSVWPPAETGVRAVSTIFPRLMLNMAGGAGPAGKSPAAIEQQRQTLLQVPRETYWNLMPEWDQSGGHWVPNGRPRYRGLTRPDAYRLFLDYYRSAYPELFQFLNLSGPMRTAVTVHAPNVHYGYEIGVEAQLLERGIDELGDLATGVAFIRGAGRQYGRRWGIDLASWRTANNSATRYEAGGIHRGGWSAEYLERHMYLSYASGADILHIQAVTYRSDDLELNRFGQGARRFADFALRRNPGLGVPVVRAALMLDHYSGFDTKHGIYNQSNAVWNRDVPFSAGDHMIDNLFRVAYPGHWEHGRAPGAPFADKNGVPDEAAFAAFFAAGGDVRPYEPMPSTRWGDCFDILTTQAPAEALKNYELIVLAGDAFPDEALREALAQWTANGGTLVINGAQSSVWDADLLGVTALPGPARPGARFRWLQEQPIAEKPFTYLPVQASTAEVLAVADGTQDPLVTRRRWGRGDVFLLTALHAQSTDRTDLLKGTVEFLDRQMDRFATALVSGPPIHYVVGAPPGKIVVTLSNPGNTVWRGRVSVPDGREYRRVREAVTETGLAFERQDRELFTEVTVPLYGVRVVVFEKE